MLKKAFNKRYNGIIWKIRPDETGRFLALEIRDPEKKEVFFSGIDTARGSVSFDRLQLQETWFCGLEGAAHGMAFLHGYLSETLPEHRGVFAVSLENGGIIWEDYNLVFSHTVKEGLIAWNYKSEPRRYQLIDPATGKPARLFPSRDELERHTSPASAAALPANARVTLPAKTQTVAFPPKTEAVSRWDDLLPSLPPGMLPSADLLEFKDYRLLAVYTLSGSTADEAPGAGEQKMDHHLYVFDGKGQLIHKDLLARDILHPAMDTFFVLSDKLYYVKSKSEILAYCL